MTIRPLYLISGIYLLGFLLGGCRNSEKLDPELCERFEGAWVESVTSAGTIREGQTLKLQVNYAALNSCGNFFDFRSWDSGEYGKDIEVRLKYSGCTCTESLVHKTVTYSYTADSLPGVHTLKFGLGPFPPVSHLVLVHE